MDGVLTNGSGEEQANMLWHDVVAIPSGSTVYVNCQSLIRTIFNKNVTVGFERIRAISIRNESIDKGAYVLVHATGVDGITGVLGNSTGRGIIHPKCSILFPNIIEGWVINATHRTLSVQDAGGSGVRFLSAFSGVLGCAVCKG